MELKTLDGQTLRLSDLRGRVVLLNFWATWCVPCRAEIPTFNAMSRELEARGFTVVGVTTQDTAGKVKEYQADYPQDYTVVLGGSDVALKYGVGPLPTTFIIDREGRKREMLIGEKTRAVFESAVLPLLDEAPAAAASVN